MNVHVCVTNLRCEKGELKIKLNVFTNKIRDLKMISSRVLRSLSNIMFINIYNTRGNANRCYSLQPHTLTFRPFKFFFPAASLISKAAKLFTSKVLLVFFSFYLDGCPPFSFSAIAR